MSLKHIPDDILPRAVIELALRDANRPSRKLTYTQTVAEEFFSLVVHQARQKRLLSDDHFTVDGTLIEAWAGQKSFQTKKDTKTLKLPPPQDPGSNPTVNFRKETRRNETHQSLQIRLRACSRRAAVPKRGSVIWDIW